MRHLALKKKQGYEDIRKGFLVLLLGVLALFLSSTPGIDSGRVKAGLRGDFFVQIEGDIRYPGVYPFDNQTSMRSLLEQGGGIISAPLMTTDLKHVPIHSGSKLTIRRGYSGLVFIPEEISPFHKITLGMPVSINMETEEGLTAVPGIGTLLARSIVTERVRRGGFKSLDELKTVRGIGDKTYNKIISYVTL